MKREWIRPLFLVAAAYDFFLGIAFLLAFKPIYAAFGVTLPNHSAYLLFGAAVVAIFGIGFWFVAGDPDRNRDIIKLGILLKLSYGGIVLGFYFRHEMPTMWVPFAYADLLFAAAFIAALRTLPAVRVGAANP
jgi:hypothetical protein